MTEDEQVKGSMRSFARYVDREIPYGWGFVILCFPFGSEGRMNYVANAERHDVVRAMYEFIAATKQAWGEHVPDPAGTFAEDELIGRLRQQVASLERQLAFYQSRYGDLTE